MATYWENSCSVGLQYVSWYKCLIVSLVFSHPGFWSRNLFLIAPFPDLCLLVPLSLIARRWVGVRLYDGPDIKLLILVGWGRSFLSVTWPTGVPRGTKVVLASLQVLVNLLYTAYRK